MSIELGERNQVVATSDGDHDRFAHIVIPPEAVTEAYITGSPVTAVCGKVWVPTRDPEAFPICPGCVEAWESMTGRPWVRS